MICINCRNTVPTGQFCTCCGWNQKKTIQITLGMIYKQWSRQHYRRLSTKGIAGYENAWRFLFPPSNREMSSITLEDYQEIIDSQRHLSRSHQEKIQQLISQLCKRAMLSGLIHINYAEYLELDGKSSTPYQAFTMRELQLLMDCAYSGDEHSETARIILILCFTGWRPEELFKIKRESVNINDRYFISGSKTQAGKNRIVPISDTIWPFILDFYLHIPDSGYLIPSPNGKRMNLQNWRTRKFYICLQVLGINPPDNPRRLKPYSTRCTFATLAYRAGVKEELLTKMIGHVDFKFTSDRYIRSDVSDFRIEAKKITQYFDNNTREVSS